MTTATGVVKTCGVISASQEQISEVTDTQPDLGRAKIGIKAFIELSLPIITICRRVARPVSDARVPQKLRANLSTQAALPQQQDPHTRTTRPDPKPPKI
jgi:hypothetical protein